MKRLTFTLFACVFCTQIFAQGESKQIAEQIAPLLNDNVVAVGHVDLDRFDPTKIDAALRPLLLDMAKASPQKESLGKEFDLVKTNLEEFFAWFKSRNIRNLYFLSIPALWADEIRFVIAFRLPETMNEEERRKTVVEAEAANGQCVIKDFMILYAKGRLDKTVKMLLGQPAKPRPEFLAALESVEGSAAQFVVIPSTSARRVIGETVDTLPSPFTALPIPVLLNGVQWAALGFDNENIKMNLVIKSKHEQSARELRTGLEKTVDAWLTETGQNIEFRLMLDMVKAVGKDAGALLKSLLPRQEGDRLLLSVDRKFLKERIDTFPAFPETLASIVFQESNRKECTKNLMQIMLAFHNHHDVYQKLPAAWTVDEAGKPLHSWRVAILPFLEQNDLYKKIRLNEPWDSEHNKQFHAQCPAVYQCPATVARNPEIKAKGLTTYSVIVGKNAFPDGGKKYEMAMITDGTSCTWGVVERAVPVCWMDPTREITQEEAEKGINQTKTGIAAPHPATECYGTNVAFFDGSVHFYTENLSLKSIPRFITRNGGEATLIEYDELPEKKK